MESSDIEEFKRYSARVRRESRYSFQMLMDEKQSKSMRMMPLDRENDPPLPGWARRLVTEKRLSKRIKLLLLKFHDDNIREQRMKTASCAATQEQNTNKEYEDE